MGAASRRKGKTLDDRIKFALDRKEAELLRTQELAEQRALQELQGWKTMVWWQLELSIERYEMFEREAHKRHMRVAEFTALMGMFGVYSFINPGRMR